MGSSSLGQHIMLRLEDDRVIAPTLADRRKLARLVLQVGRPYRLLAFNCPDTHLHAEAACSREAAGELVRRLEIGLQQRLALESPFTRPRYKEIRDQQHLQRTLLYILRQQEHHGCQADRYHDASNLPDLLGLRLVGAYTAENVRSLLPRVRRADLLAVLGVPDLESPAEPALDLLAAAAAAAAGLPALAGQSRQAVDARRAAVHAAGRRSNADLAAALGCSQRTIRRLRSTPPPGALTRAILLQLHLRAARGSAPEDSPELIS